MGTTCQMSALFLFELINWWTWDGTNGRGDLCFI